ncbi:transmembrane protein 91-like isoform X2 [Rhinatrema bivittatum]|uniref:transmembrane protein 91-like isoform X2 n=1 Tax=Rhinatrema bivittatum TaxID=194408 RepID=UPI0011272210|nr:transmembrane protein 91-like isoform X2 [Rhinatrema bivittatum]
MDNTGSETEKLNPQQVSPAANVPPGYGAVRTDGTPEPPPYSSSSAGYGAATGGYLYPPNNPRQQGYSSLSNEGDGMGGPHVWASRQTTVILAPLHEPDYLGFSIFTMLCCCLPLGIAALVFSSMTQESNRRGDAFAARRNSQWARTLNYLALGIGVCFLVISIIVVIVVLQNHPSRDYP